MPQDEAQVQVESSRASGLELYRLHGILAASLALLVPGIPPRDRRVLRALASMPIILSALSDTRE